MNSKMYCFRIQLKNCPEIQGELVELIYKFPSGIWAVMVVWDGNCGQKTESYTDSFIFL